MDNIILYLLAIIQEQYQQIYWLILFICRYIPLKQWAHDELHSPKYQRFLTDKLPVIKPFIKQDWHLWNEYYRLRYGKAVKPVKTQKARHATFLKIPYAPLRGLRMSTSMTIQVGVDSSNAKSAARPCQRREGNGSAKASVPLLRPCPAASQRP